MRIGSPMRLQRSNNIPENLNNHIHKPETAWSYGKGKLPILKNPCIQLMVRSHALGLELYWQASFYERSETFADWCLPFNKNWRVVGIKEDIGELLNDHVIDKPSLPDRVCLCQYILEGSEGGWIRNDWTGAHSSKAKAQASGCHREQQRTSWNGRRN